MIIFVKYFYSMTSSFARQSSKHWFHMLIGMFLVIIVNSLVVIGIVFNIHFLLIPWQLVYTLGELCIQIFDTPLKPNQNLNLELKLSWV